MTQQCEHDCCQHEHSCASQCLDICVSAGVSSLPVSIHTLLPAFRLSVLNFSISSHPDGAELHVLERPPRLSA